MHGESYYQKGFQRAKKELNNRVKEINGFPMPIPNLGEYYEDLIENLQKLDGEENFDMFSPEQGIYLFEGTYSKNKKTWSF
jgi:hypothetical protein